MPASSRALVELLLLGPSSDKRQLQDSPVLGDVWIAFAEAPASAIDLLITPYQGRPAGPLAATIVKRLAKVRGTAHSGEEALVASLQGLVAARLFFDELLRVVVPMTSWWKDPKIQDQLKTYKPTALLKKVEAVVRWARTSNADEAASLAKELVGLSALDRFVALAAFIWWAGHLPSPAAPSGVSSLLAEPDVEKVAVDRVVGAVHDIRKQLVEDKFETDVEVWQVSLNRKAMAAVEQSVPSVKGDAARTLFNVRCDRITWAVLDSGIDSGHAVFRDREGKNRIVKALDFSNVRQIVSLDNLNTGTSRFRERLVELRRGREKELSAREATQRLKRLASDAADDRPIDWALVETLIEIAPGTAPRGGHGTHVAGIIGANSEAGPASRQPRRDRTSNLGYANGMCPDIRFYDLRVLGETLGDTEFAVIAALQYVRYLNERHNYMSVHGVNLSLSIPHDVRNFACGRTPICVECERLVESGVVVVAAAGNLGYQQFETKDGSYGGYTAFSITDPGNADGVITVGSTHRNRPHTYGVSFFSSRGPTGDGRLKPDLVAPGERIASSLPNQDWGELDGTSMAAPHVSGAAAMLMARYTELIGKPRRVKQVLCESATDLGRERSFQGHGMLDVLRAFQSI
jgi:serine protease AprX